MPIELGGATSFGPGGMNVSSQISGLQELDMPEIDLSGLRYLRGPQNSGGGWAGGGQPQRQAPAAPPREMIQYTTGVTPQGVQYRTATNGPNAGQVEYTSGMPERFGGYVGAQPGYPSAGGR